MSSISDLSVISSSSPSSYFFKEREAFKNIKELVFLSYYKEFKLLLYSLYFSTIFPLILTFKSVSNAGGEYLKVVNIIYNNKARNYSLIF